MVKGSVVKDWNYQSSTRTYHCENICDQDYFSIQVKYLKTIPLKKKNWVSNDNFSSERRAKARNVIFVIQSESDDVQNKWEVIFMAGNTAHQLLKFLR